MNGFSTFGLRSISTRASRIALRMVTLVSVGHEEGIASFKEGDEQFFEAKSGSIRDSVLYTFSDREPPEPD
jgi:hypothetical protein